MANKTITPIVKVCSVCSKEFLVGGRGRPAKDAVFCSKVCSAKARVHTPITGTLSVKEAAYLAGLFDGEGSLVAAKQRENRITWRMTICNCMVNIVQWCRDVTGVGTVFKHEHEDPKHHDVYYWQIYSWNAEDVMRQIYPYMLHGEKRSRAEKLFDQMDEIRSKNT